MSEAKLDIVIRGLGSIDKKFEDRFDIKTRTLKIGSTISIKNLEISMPNLKN